MTVLVTGGAGFVGTHVLCALAASGRRSISIDNYSNSSPRSIDRVLKITPGSVEAFEADLRDTAKLRRILSGRAIDSVIHLAGLKSVADSVADPRRYHDNNVGGARSLLEAVASTGARTVVFSSSATVYGISGDEPIDEATPISPKNAYGENKLAVEGLLNELAGAQGWRVANLRYFNPVGAHESGLIGEDPAGTPNNLMPYLCRVATGRLPELRIFGSDYPTRDGTGVRDYIHVMDLAEGHLAALSKLGRSPDGTALTVNLGTGRGTSVLELIQAFERVNNLSIPRTVVARRPGDIAEYFASAELAAHVLGWRAKRGIEEMCRDAWRWQSANPDGYSP